MIIGIDLGTTNSAVGVWRDGRPELIPNSLGHRLTPSVVGLDDEGRLLVGLAARERQPTHPHLTAATFKRYMGTRRTVALGRRSYLPEELSALVLRSLKADAEAWLGQRVDEAVITVPAYFNDRQRKATRKAGELAGLKVERLINEPTAAALAFGMHDFGAEARFLVFDLGGGTFDVSILEMFEGIIEVRASTGDNRLGGEDFNDVLVSDMYERLRALGKVPAIDHAPLRERLRAAAERVRRALTGADRAAIQIVWDGKAIDYEIEAERFESLCAGLIERLRGPVLQAMQDGKLRVEALDEIVLVGGATRMPMVRKAATRMFGRFPSFAVDPDEAVAMGAAILAGLKARDAALKEVVLTDVCPYSLGVDTGALRPDGSVEQGIFSPIIDRNTVVPASRVRRYSTLQPGQTKVRFSIYQGESRRVAENVKLGQIEIGVPAVDGRKVEVQCRFSYDINGLIEVDVLVPETGEQRQLVIVDEEGVDPRDLAERRAAMAALKVHPRDQDANRAVLARAARCFESQLGERREQVGRLIQQFEAILERQEPRAIERARLQVDAHLDTLEGETFL